MAETRNSPVSVMRRIGLTPEKDGELERGSEYNRASPQRAQRTQRLFFEKDFCPSSVCSVVKSSQVLPEVAGAHQQFAERLGHLDVAVVAGWQFVIAPAVLFRFFGKRIENHASGIFVGDAGDVASSQPGGRVCRQPNGLLEAVDRKIRQARLHELPGRPVFEAPQVELPVAGWKTPSIAVH